MGYKGKDHREKGKNRICSEAYRVLPTEDYKTIVGENRCNDISFRPLTGLFQERQVGVYKNEFLPKRGFFCQFWENTTIRESKE